MRWAFAAVVALAGCLSAFGPDLRASGPHAGLGPSSESQRCMNCHMSEREAMAAGVDEEHPAPSPIVAEWMLEHEQTCVDCHRVRGGLGHARE